MIISCLLPIKYKNLLEDRSGVSPVIGMILILSIVVISVGIIYTTGIPFIDSIKYNTQVFNAQNSFSVLQNDVLEIINGPVTGVGMGRITKVEMGGGSIFVEPNNTEIQINYTGSSNPVTAVPGTITYNYRSRSVIFENGGVFTKYTTSSFMEIDPMIFVTDLGSGNIGLMIHIINVTGPNSSIGGEGTGKIRTSFEERTNLYSGEVNSVNIKISTQNSDSWGRYFNDTLSNAGLDHSSGDFRVNQSSSNVEIGIDVSSGGNYIQLSIYETKILTRVE
jgi:FlaG/FlaF family flagellin (archaellin)